MTEHVSNKPDNRALMLNALRKIDELQEKLDQSEQQHKEDIAIVGMSCRFPGAEAGIESYRSLLTEGRDAITEMPKDRWQVDDYYDADPDKAGKMYVREGGFVKQLDQFDAGFFDISPREAMAMDPQQRLWLEACWEALEHGNIVPADLFASQTGVFVGASSFDFAAILAKSLPIDQIDAYLGTGASLNILAGRLSYLLGLTGPGMAVDTACSSSLVAVHNACQSLRLGECDLAITGGVNVILAPETYVAFSRAAMLSPEARCKTFAETADGFIRSEGCGAIILKRLSDAQKQGDKIWAVIKGSAVNQDGASGGLTVPSGPSQQAVIKAALKTAKVKPEQINYIEAHGTGTPLGDPIEMRALAACYGLQRNSEQTVYVASVKTNLGHLEAAAGIAGLIKTALSLNYAEIYPHLHFSSPSQHIDWQSWPVKIPVKFQPWAASTTPRAAAVSAFGLSGTNAHIIMQQAPELEKQGVNCQQNSTVPLLVLSAKTQTALQNLATNYAQQVFSQTDANIVDICFSANQYRSRFKHRLVLTEQSVTDFKVQLEHFAKQGTILKGAYNATAKLNPTVAFLFTGQGSQWAGMSAKMYGYYPVFTQKIDICDQLLSQHSDIKLKKLLLESSTEAVELIKKTEYAQPVLFAFEYAWAQQWLAWGVKPACMMGHSLGEYVAACLAGVFSLEQGLKLIVERARLMQLAPGSGSMASVFASVDKVRELLKAFPLLSIAVFNSADNQVVSGEANELKNFLNACSAQAVEYSVLHTSHGFHSKCMEPVSAPFSKALSAVDLKTAVTSIVSNLTGQRETKCFNQADYWLQHLRQPVQFQQGIQALAQCVDLVIEIGPKPVLTSLAKQSQLKAVTIATCRGDNGIASIKQSIAEVVAEGLELDWQQLGNGQRLSLPTYPWQRKRYWPEWLNTQPVSIADNKPQAGQWLSSSAFAENTEVFELKLNAASWPWLTQHQVYKHKVAPLAVFIAMIYEALFKRFDHLNFTVYELEIERALLIPEQGSVYLQLILQQTDKGYSFQILSQIELESNWYSHVSGHISQETLSQLADFQHPEKSACRLIEGQQFYQLFVEHGLEYGANFQGIDQLWQQDHKAWAELNKRPDAIKNISLNPLILDMAMQMLAAVLPVNANTLSLPSRIRKIQCFAKQLADCHYLSAEVNAAEQVDIALYNSQQHALFSMSGIEVVAVSKNQLQKMLNVSLDWLYQTVWQGHTANNSDAKKSWLLISDKPSNTCADQLIEQGHTVQLATLQQLAGLDLNTIDEIVDLTALSLPADAKHSMRACVRLLEILKQDLPKLTLATQQAVGEFSQTPHYAGAGLWGMAAVLFQEHAELKPRIIDVSSMEYLCPALLDNSGEQRLFSSESGLKVQRLQHYRPNNSSSCQNNIDSKARYLVTGGLGALGRLTVSWLAEQGATQIYLTTRQNQPEVPEELLQLQQQSPALELIICSTDIGSEQAVINLFKQIKWSGKSLKGIVHCAGFTDDDRLLNQSVERLQKLDQAKLQGALLLDKYSGDCTLDFFLLYSSFNALVGSVGQGGYAAANAAMDALAWQRRQQGKPALTINWGPWETGMQASEQSALYALWQQSGIGLIDRESGRKLIEQAINEPQAQLCMAYFDWQKMSSTLATEDVPSILKELIKGPVKTTFGRDWLKELQAVDSEQLRNSLTEFVSQQLASILKLTVEQIDLDCPLSSLGLDSLAAVEFRSIMRKTLQLEVPVSQLLQSEGWGLVSYLEQKITKTSQGNTLALQDEGEGMIEGEL